MKLKYRFVIWLMSGHWKVKAFLFGMLAGVLGVVILERWVLEMQGRV